MDFPKEIVNCPRNLPKVMVVLEMIKQNGREAIKDRLWGKEGKIDLVLLIEIDLSSDRHPSADTHPPLSCKQTTL